MTGYLVPVSKSRKRKKNSGNPQKKGTGAQARVQGQAKAVLDNPEHEVKNVLLDEPKIHQPEIHTPRLELTHPAPAPEVMAPVRRGLPLKGKLAIGGTLLAGGAGGAYLYQRRRVEKSLSSWHSDYPSMMMRST